MAIYYCNSLTSIVIPDNVKYIAERAFHNCKGITNITIGKGVTSIGELFDFACPKITDITVAEDNAIYKSIDGALYSKDGKTLIRYPSGKQGAVTLPHGVVTLAPEAFNGATCTTLTLPNSVTTIEDHAFNYAEIASVIIPASVTYIGEYAFIQCEYTDITIAHTKDSIPGAPWWGNGVTIHWLDETVEYEWEEGAG
jgi:hypothetical protein